jgi:hypothetical protein
MDLRTNTGPAHPVRGVGRSGGTERRRESFLWPQRIAAGLARSCLNLF